ncbi:MAG TPA: BACON domain-containing protein, partial [Thermoanaerobaculales bacterium]|nr:BACON domain-containing protein [Thermoanaerobaculales bacterium]
PAPPPPCTASVSPASASFTSGGGQAEVQLSTGGDCEWTAESSESWLGVQPGSGTGDAVLRLTAAPNRGSATRNATVTIAGERLSVTQEGAPVEEVRVEGRVRDLTGTCPIVRFRIRGTTITTSPGTRYGPDPPGAACGDLRNGRTVTVTGLERDGGVEATLILFETNGPNP